MYVRNNLLIIAPLFLSICISCKEENAYNNKGNVISIKPKVELNDSNQLLLKNAGLESVMKFETYEGNFGEVRKGSLQSLTFKFVNTGDSNLVISSITASCECQSINYSDYEIPKGGSGFIKVNIDTKMLDGFQRKKITVRTNSYPEIVYLFINGYVYSEER